MTIPLPLDLMDDPETPLADTFEHGPFVQIRQGAVIFQVDGGPSDLRGVGLGLGCWSGRTGGEVWAVHSEGDGWGMVVGGLCLHGL